MTQKIVEPFVFEEHIFKADYSIDIKETKRKLEKRFLFPLGVYPAACCENFKLVEQVFF